MLQSQIDLVEESFFDDQIETFQSHSPYKKQGIWISEQLYDSQKKESGFKANNTILLEDMFLRSDPLTNKMEEFYYVLYSDRIEAFTDKDKEELSGICLIQKSKLLFTNSLVERPSQLADTGKFYLMLSRNRYFDTLYTDSEETFNKWLEYLKKLCILSNFSNYYEAQAEIGQGTFAKVILTKCKQDGKEYATKIFKKKELFDSVQQEKVITALQNEIMIMKYANHDHILDVHEIYEGQQRIYIVMELASLDLFTYFQDKKSDITEQICQQFTKQLLDSLQFIHSFGIAHRDLKPENILLRANKEQHLLLADFGLSENLNKQKLLFQRCGTPGYVAPEILKDLPYDTKVDIFSLGIILFTLISGQSPFYGESYTQIYSMNKSCTIEYKLINQLNISQECKDFIKKLLDPDQLQRYSANQALQDPWIKKTDFPKVSIKKEIKKLNFPQNVNFGSKNFAVNSPNKVSLTKKIPLSKDSPIATPQSSFSQLEKKNSTKNLNKLGKKVSNISSFAKKKQ